MESADPNSSYSGLVTDESPQGKMSQKRRLANAKTVIGIVMRDAGTCTAESNMYGAALVMPQLARTLGWDPRISAMAIRSCFFLLLNFTLQAYLLKMVAVEQNVFDLYAGKMALCDFGAWVIDCPGPGCIGPGGTDVTAARMYGFTSWSDRKFVRDSLKAVFPDREDQIQDLVDPGEYGVESYGCRLICCFIFMIAMQVELNVIYKLVKLLYHVPTADEPWIDSTEGDGFEDVTLKIAGMPLRWKIINAVVIVAPKILIFKQMSETGITALMQTSGIADIISSCVSLAFIVNLDELLFYSLMSDEIQNLVTTCNDFPLYDVKEMAKMSDAELLERHVFHQAWSSFTCKETWMLLPHKLMLASILTVFFVYYYYALHCETSPDGRQVSKEMYAPETVDYSWPTAFFPFLFPQSYRSESFWQMPTLTSVM